MTGGEWKPGDILVTPYGRVFYSEPDGVGAWTYDDGSGGFLITGKGLESLQPNPPGNSRPLVVIDPEDREQVERLRDVYDLAVITMHADPDLRDVTPEQRTTAMQAALREFADPKPPKPDEPQGLGAVVECTGDNHYVRMSTDDPESWAHVEGPGDGRWAWERLRVVRVLAEGVAL